MFVTSSGAGFACLPSYTEGRRHHFHGRISMNTALVILLVLLLAWPMIDP